MRKHRLLYRSISPFSHYHSDLKAAQHLLGSLAMHQVEGDLGGGVNISANLVHQIWCRVFLT